MKRWSTGLGEGPDTIEPAGGVEAGDSEDVDGDPGVMSGSTMTNTRRKNCNSALWNAMVSPLRFVLSKRFVLQIKVLVGWKSNAHETKQRFGSQRVPLVPRGGQHTQR